MNIFGIRFMRNSTYENDKSLAEQSGENKARRKLVYQTEQELLRKFAKAPVIITEVKLMNPPESEMYRDAPFGLYSYKEFSGAKYKVKFRLNGTNDEVSIELEFDDYDVSISDLQRAIQARIFGKEGDYNGGE